MFSKTCVVCFSMSPFPTVCPSDPWATCPEMCSNLLPVVTVAREKGAVDLKTFGERIS
jgi:hypothetical protein